ncbi:unnamed protein product [Paramecium sonneborni]|uniref:Uncharacterized protein n=1 Tax=Paramecium sonneborni TaxID=65129 RepID=A0A8S1RIL7_9CILI|nr:unnamed protein product [Paramecium sonneborni]
MNSNISLNLPVFYVSAKTGQNVQKCFNKIFQSLTPQKTIIQQKTQKNKSCWGFLCSC